MVMTQRPVGVRHPLLACVIIYSVCTWGGGEVRRRWKERNDADSNLQAYAHRPGPIWAVNQFLGDCCLLSFLFSLAKQLCTLL